MRIKTSELIGAALDWAVTTCEGLEPRICKIGVVYDGPFDSVHRAEFSTDWAKGGPIIEREWLHVVPWPNETDEELRWQCHQHDCIDTVTFGPTPLIAAMRCYVASKLGEEVEVPDELVS